MKRTEKELDFRKILKELNSWLNTQLDFNNRAIEHHSEANSLINQYHVISLLHWNDAYLSVMEKINREINKAKKRKKSKEGKNDC